MSNKTPFQMKILRYIHDSFTGEFLNIGLALFAQNENYFRVRLLHKYARITNTFPNADGEHYRRYINSLQRKFDNLVDQVTSEQMDFYLSMNLDGLLSTVLTPDDSAVQFGPLQGGMTGDLDDVFNDLYYRLVEAYTPTDERVSRSEQEIWSLYSKSLQTHSVVSLLRSTTIQTPNSSIELDHAWKNGKWKALQPLSFDLLHRTSIDRKARLWLGTNVILQRSEEIAKVYYLLGEPRRDDKDLKKAYNDAKDLLGTGDYADKVEIIEENEAEDFAREISSKIKQEVDHA